MRHFLTVTGFSHDEQFVIANDSLKGEVKIPVEQFNQAWQANGARGVVVAPKPIPTIPDSTLPLFAGVGAAAALAALAALGTARKGLGAGQVAEDSWTNYDEPAVQPVDSWSNYVPFAPDPPDTWFAPPPSPATESPQEAKIEQDFMHNAQNPLPTAPSSAPSSSGSSHDGVVPDAGVSDTPAISTQVTQTTEPGWGAKSDAELMAEAEKEAAQRRKEIKTIEDAQKLAQDEAEKALAKAMRDNYKAPNSLDSKINVTTQDGKIAGLASLAKESVDNANQEKPWWAPLIDGAGSLFPKFFPETSAATSQAVNSTINSLKVLAGAMSKSPDTSTALQILGSGLLNTTSIASQGILQTYGALWQDTVIKPILTNIVRVSDSPLGNSVRGLLPDTSAAVTNAINSTVDSIKTTKAVMDAAPDTATALQVLGTGLLNTASVASQGIAQSAGAAFNDIVVKPTLANIVRVSDSPVGNWIRSVMPDSTRVWGNEVGYAIANTLKGTFDTAKATVDAVQKSPDISTAAQVLVAGTLNVGSLLSQGVLKVGEATFKKQIYDVATTVTNTPDVGIPTIVSVPSEVALASSLNQMSQLDPVSNKPISPVGADVSRLINKRGGANVLPLALPTDRGGMVPWRGYVVMGLDWGDNKITGGSLTAGGVAHELTHVLERDLDDPTYWPSGAAPNSTGLWYFDSTNHMEAVSYLIGFTVQYDLLAARLADPSLTPADRNAIINDDLPKLADRIATFAGPDSANATRYVVAYGDNPVYDGNYVKELQYPDKRIPSGGWESSLKQMGFSNDSIQHIKSIAAKGTVEYIAPTKIDPATGKYIGPQIK